MQFIQSFLLVASSLLLLFIAQYSFTHRKTPGAFAFFIMIIATLVWTLGSLCEISAATLQGKLFWRNIEQIGVFGLPISTVYFAVVYTKNTKYLKYVYTATIPSLLSVILIFTNELHHLMRSGYTLEASTVYHDALVVHSTVFGSILVAYNFILPFTAIAILLSFSRNISPKFRRQIYIIVFCFLYTFIVAWVKTAFFEQLGIYIQISVLNTPSALLIFLSIFKHRTFSLSPIARDKVFEVVDQGILVTDDEGTIVDINSYAHSVMEEYLHINAAISAKLKDVNPQYPALNQLIGLEHEERIEIKVNHEAEKTYLTLDYYPLYHNKNRFIGSVIIINNITMQKIFEHSLKEKAEKDYLTCFFNKFGFQKTVQKYLLRGNLQQYSVLMIDVDNFKRINDNYGHAAGDTILRHFTDIVKRFIRSEDIAGRIGGDEFVVVIPNIPKDTALQIAERIRKAIETSEITFNAQTAKYTISVGIADNQAENATFDEILENADHALYEAKSKCRNCSIVFCKQDD